MNIEQIFNSFNDECNRQDEKWGVRNQHPAVWLSILTEEIGEVAKEINDGGFDTAKIDLEKYRAELIQCGAVITQMLKNTKDYEIRIENNTRD